MTFPKTFQNIYRKSGWYSNGKLSSLYIEQRAASRNLKLKMKPKGRFVIIEYDTQRINSWVPYPISFIELKELFIGTLGYPKTEKIAPCKSVYQE